MGISIGMVGVGQFGKHFIPIVKAHPDVARLALCDLSADLLGECAREFEIAETYPSLDAICRSDLDALMIITQHWLHGPQAVQALRAGKHVYTAVPCAYSLEQCDQLVTAVRETGGLYMTGETSFFYPDTAYCRRRFAEGAFGEIVHGEAEYFHDMSHGLVPILKKRWGDQFGMDKTGDPPMYYPTHSTSFLISVTGAHMTEVSAQGYALPGDDWYRADTIWKNPFSNEVALFRMSNGAAARICEFRRVGHPGAVRFCLYGTQGSFERSLAGAVWATTEGAEPVDPPSDHEPLPPELQRFVGHGHAGAEAYLVNEFVSSVRDQRQPRTNVWQAVRYAAPGLVAHESAMRGGELMNIPDWGSGP
jgi:predicted dehydrogenase